MNCRTAFTALSLAATISSLGVLFAAPPKAEQPAKKNPAVDSATRPADQKTGWRTNDQMLASCVAIENQEEIALAKFAEERTKNEDVRKFAEMMSADHAAFLKKLQKYAPEAARDGFLQRELTSTEKSRPENPNATQRTAAKPPLDERAEMPLDPLQLQREIAQQCLADTEAMLEKKTEQEFDACFVGFQLVKHAAMKTKLAVFQRHATGDLAQLFAEGMKTTSAHQEHAEKLMKKLDGASRTTAEKSSK